MIIAMLNHYESHMEVEAPVECIAAQERCHIVAPPAPPLSPQSYKEKKYRFLPVYYFWKPQILPEVVTSTFI